VEQRDVKRKNERITAWGEEKNGKRIEIGSVKWE
jgi:hypothetical protein